ncbi:MAG: hypothetical protein ABIA63_11555 [bacterium]
MNMFHVKHFNTAPGMAAIVIWSTGVAFSRTLTEGLGPLNAACLVYLIAGTFGCAHFFIKKKIIKKLKNQSPWYLFGCGALFIIYIACFYLAIGLSINRSQVLVVGLINYLYFLSFITALSWVLYSVLSPEMGRFCTKRGHCALYNDSRSKVMDWLYSHHLQSNNMQKIYKGGIRCIRNRGDFPRSRSVIFETWIRHTK